MKEIDFVAGLTIKEAISRAHKQALILKEPVAANINDIVIIIDANTDQEKILTEYYLKHKFKYEIESLKRQKDKQQ